MSGVPPVTPQLPSLSAFDALLDRERSAAFHRGEQGWDEAGMRALLEALPPLPAATVDVQIVGSEGKSSTALILSAALMAHGFEVGTFTSPHLRDPRERLRLDLELPTEAQLAPAVAEVVRAAEPLANPPSWFEALTATAARLFAQQGCTARVWEAGLGGRLDATTLLPAGLVVLSSVSLEHTAILGPTLEAIANEKLAALRPGLPVLLAHDLPAVVEDLARARAEALGCPLSLAPAPDPGESSARGRALARGACEVLRAQGALPEAHAAERSALGRARVPGRDALHGEVLFDGAHSVAACAELARRLQAVRPGWLVFGATSGRDALAMLEPLLPLVQGVVLTRAPGGREQDPVTIAAALPEGVRWRVEEDPGRALELARELGGTGRRIVVTGSLYVVGRLLPDENPAP